MQYEVDIKNLTIDAYTTPCPICIRENMRIPKIISLMEENGIRHLPVVNEQEEAIGMITDRDISTVKSFAFNKDLVAGDLMTREKHGFKDYFSSTFTEHLIKHAPCNVLVLRHK